MPKKARDPKSKSKPYAGTNRASTKKQTATAKIGKRPKTDPKTMKLRNESLTKQLDDLLTNVTPHLISKGQKKVAGNRKTEGANESKQDIEAAQREYEKMNNDMEDALGLLTKL